MITYGNKGDKTMKFKVTVTTIKYFETTMEDYPDCKTEDEALEAERVAADDDPYLSTEGGETTVNVVRID
jgi:hypothetical protein